MMRLEYKIEGKDFSNAGYASSQVKKILKKLNVDSKIIKRVVIAMYEAEVNIVAHAYRGDISVEIDATKILIRAVDEGPGIEDIEKAMEVGYSTASPKVREMGFGAGMGLPNIKRNSDRFEIYSEIGKGTEVEILSYLEV